MFSRLGSYLARIFDFRDQTPEGFPLTGQVFVVPENALALDPRAKRTVTICNLFANQHRSIKKIAELLDTTTPEVISALIEEGIIADRRLYSSERAQLERRGVPKYHLPCNPDDLLRSLCGAIGADIVSDFVFLEVLRNDERCEECLVRYRRRGH